MIPLNLETVKDVEVILARKTDWAVAFSVSSDSLSARVYNDKRFIIASCHDNWLLVGYKPAVQAIIFLMERILGRSFLLRRDDSNYLIFVRDDCVEKREGKSQSVPLGFNESG